MGFNSLGNCSHDSSPYARTGNCKALSSIAPRGPVPIGRGVCQFAVFLDSDHLFNVSGRLVLYERGELGYLVDFVVGNAEGSGGGKMPL